jgi:hypothetical protein
MIERVIHIITWEPILHLQGCTYMVKVFRESHEKDVERLSTDRPCQSESKEDDVGSRSSTTDQHTSTFTIHKRTQSVYSCVRLHDMKTDMLCVVQSKVRPQLGITVVLREVWTKNFKTSPTEEDDVEMTGEGEESGDSSRDEDDFEKQMCLVNESDKTTVIEDLVQIFSCFKRHFSW